MNCLHILLSVASLHLGPGHFNQINPGLFAQCHHVEVGYYLNSHDRDSALIGYTGDWFMAGLVSGYSDHVMPYVAVHHEIGLLDILATPMVQDYDTRDGQTFAVTGVLLGFRVRLNP